MKILVVLVVLLLVPEGAMAARWEASTVPAYDFLPESLGVYLQANVADYNANLPPEVPRLIYTPMGELPCEALPPNGLKGGISYCLTYVPFTDARVAETRPRRRGDRFISAMVVLRGNPPPDLPRRPLCHETTHAFFDAPDVDDPDSRVGRTDSCVQGTLDHLGPWDIAYAEGVYSHDSAPRNRAGGKHHRAKRGRGKIVGLGMMRYGESGQDLAGPG